MTLPESTLTELERLIVWQAKRASGSGGQNVNKVATALELRLDLHQATCLPEAMRQRLLKRNDRRITAAGLLIIDAQQFRTQEQNRRDAWRRLLRLLESAAKAPKKRIATKPKKSAIKRAKIKKQQHKQRKKARRTDWSRHE